MPERPSAWRVIGKSLLWALGGAVLAPFVALAAAVPLYYFNTTCGTPGDSGGCEMGFAAMVITSPVVGAAVGFVLGAARTLWRLQGSK